MLEKSEIRFLPHGARRVAYEMRGVGPPLVAPAWWVSHLELDWQSVGFRRFWEGVATGYTLIRYDRLGVGMSDRTVRGSDLSLDGEVATLRALLDELELDRVSLIGGSSGSCTAIAFAAAFPERVERLVLYGSYPNGAALTAPGVRSRPRFRARHSSRCRGARTSRGTMTPIPWSARAAKRWHRCSRRRTIRASRNRSCCPVVSVRFLPVSLAVSAIARSQSSWC